MMRKIEYIGPCCELREIPPVAKPSRRVKLWKNVALNEDECHSFVTSENGSTARLIDCSEKQSTKSK